MVILNKTVATRAAIRYFSTPYRALGHHSPPTGVHTVSFSPGSTQVTKMYLTKGLVKPMKTLVGQPTGQPEATTVFRKNLE